MEKPYQVLASKRLEKQMRKLPNHIKEAVLIWICTVEEIGMRETRKMNGYHDEPLRGSRMGQRSVRLNRAYRLFYRETEKSHFIQLTVLEVNHHEY